MYMEERFDLSHASDDTIQLIKRILKIDESYTEEDYCRIGMEFSKWALLNKIYESKYRYYKGLKTIRDQEYDSLENTFKVLHGEETLEEWTCVGYDENKHKTIRTNLLIADVISEKAATYEGRKCIRYMNLIKDIDAGLI